ncbi:MAG: GGDEF domain-containing protein [Treponema sp.]|nr:GGDEF domain-containing protein [Treponema sp.]
MIKELLNNENKELLANSKIAGNVDLLQELGILEYIENMHQEVNTYKSLLNRGLDIFNHTSIDEILDATVFQISDHFLPSFIAFLWKPIQNREDITIKSYKNHEPVDMKIKVDSIAPLESFFRQYPRPINFELLAFELKDDKAVMPFKEVDPEIVVPILGQFGLYGIILVGRKTEKGGYNVNELSYLQQLMCFVSQAIKNHLHYEHSLRDIKTGLYNHGFFMTRLCEEISRTKRNSYTSSIIVMDVDRFKNFNDSYGHLAGDKVLEHLAHMIRQGVRNDDIPSRFGGEEFTILLPHSDKNTVWTVAERLRTSIAGMKVPWGVPLPQVTISLGIFSFDQNTNADVEEIVRRADVALYTSKRRGRNCSTIWTPELNETQTKKDSPS